MNDRSSFVGEGEAQRCGRILRSGVRHVLGTAFPYTDVASPRDTELERSFLQLAYAVCCLARSHESCAGYFAVVSQEARDAAQRLVARYEVGDSVRIVFASLLVADMTRLSDAAEAASREGDPTLLICVAREIGLDALRREIASTELGGVEVQSDEAPPFGVHWDYYGRARAIQG
ncbi:MAG: hypothetical protein E4G93_00560 [Dehalococcoidia bacterium]|nr:MAG: hypothetical protein E4G93_00560 [Dehalococcoidia bacterium]